ncbi:MAG TPA: hypothetical protein VH851_15095 [Candidatus Binatia bacterium]|jgi:hypothetical protein
MWSRSYRKHVIMAFPSFDAATNSWAPQADISWPTGPERESEFVRFPLRVMSESEAVACALRRGRSWIDNRLKAHSSQNATSLTVDRIDTLANSFPRSNLKPPAKSSLVRSDPSEAFTFAQFKSAVTESGTKLSESALRKSYNGLMQLQKKKNCSMAQVRATLSRVQKLLASRSTGRAQRCRLPLTERDWRKIT